MREDRLHLQSYPHRQGWEESRVSLDRVRIDEVLCLVVGVERDICSITRFEVADSFPSRFDTHSCAQRILAPIQPKTRLKDAFRGFKH